MLDKSTEAKANHWVLANKKTGKVASSNNWLLALAAHTQTQRNTSGVASLLSHDKAKRTLVRNELALKPMRGIKNEQVTANVRLEARAMLPYMAAVFGEKKFGCAAVSKNEFCTWITEQLYAPLSDMYKTAAVCELNDLLENPHPKRWCQDQLNKMQS